MQSSRTMRAVMLEGELYQRQDNGTLKPLKGKTDWKRLDAMTDAQVTAAAEADPDAKPMTDDEWAMAALTIPPKVSVGMRLDADVLAWFKKRGAGYQTRINAVLRRYIEAQKKAG
ncbi:MAG: BrnA antitoxin family protein [Beijerinckiaceae bacterium]